MTEAHKIEDYSLSEMSLTAPVHLQNYAFAKIFKQSGVHRHAELHLLLSMITPLSSLERVPTYKDQQEKLITETKRIAGAKAQRTMRIAA